MNISIETTADRMLVTDQASGQPLPYVDVVTIAFDPLLRRTLVYLGTSGDSTISTKSAAPAPAPVAATPAKP